MTENLNGALAALDIAGQVLAGMSIVGVRGRGCRRAGASPQRMYPLAITTLLAPFVLASGFQLLAALDARG